MEQLTTYPLVKLRFHIQKSNLLVINTNICIISQVLLIVKIKMQTINEETKISKYSIGLWSIGVSFLLFQFFLQLSSSVIILKIMNEMKLSASIAGLLSSSFYLIYTALQIPVGVLFDTKNTRTLLSFNAFLCSCGCIIFATSTSLPGLFIGRILIGGGSAFAFVGLSHLLRQYFPKNKFAFMIGFSETLGFLVTAIGIGCVGELVSNLGWRIFIIGAAALGVSISFFCYRYIPNSILKHVNPPDKKQMYSILVNYKLWLNGIFVGLVFSIVTVFGALWAIPFIKAKLLCSTQAASYLCGMYFVGAGLSCPLFGGLSSRVNSRRNLIITSCLLTAILLCMLLYIPSKSILFVATTLFLIGLSCGAYMLAYSISNELAPHHLQSSATGFTNTLAVIFSPILQPLVGFLLDHFRASHSFLLFTSSAYDLMDYQKALSIMPLSLLLASLIAFFLPDKKSYSKSS